MSLMEVKAEKWTPQPAKNAIIAKITEGDIENKVPVE